MSSSQISSRMFQFDKVLQIKGIKFTYRAMFSQFNTSSVIYWWNQWYVLVHVCLRFLLKCSYLYLVISLLSYYCCDFSTIVLWFDYVSKSCCICPALWSVFYDITLYFLFCFSMAMIYSRYTIHVILTPLYHTSNFSSIA